MRHGSARAAWGQGVGVVAVAVALGAALLHAHQRPFDRTTLAIPVGLLQSQAAEASLLAAQLRQDELAPGFVGQHARQLADNVRRERAQLASRPAQVGLAAQQRQARALAASLEEALAALARDPRAPRRGSGLDALARRLQALQARLDPGG